MATKTKAAPKKAAPPVGRQPKERAPTRAIEGVPGHGGRVVRVGKASAAAKAPKAEGEKTVFRVIFGKAHLESLGLGVKTPADGWFESELPLDTMFVNKFERLGLNEGEGETSDVLRARIDSLQKKLATAERTERRAAIAESPDSEVYDQPIQDEDPEDEDDGDVDEGGEVEVDAAKATTEEETEEEEVTEPADYGEDMTDTFDGAEDKGLQVFKDGRKYTVCADGEPVVDGEGLTKGAAATLVEEYDAE